MDVATIIVSIAVPVAIVLVAIIIRPSLSGLIWREFLKLSKPAESKPSAEQQNDSQRSQQKGTEHREGPQR
jgi:hypothetical protein